MLHGIECQRTDNGVAVKAYWNDPRRRRPPTVFVVFDFSETGHLAAFRMMLQQIIQDTYTWPDPPAVHASRYTIRVEGAGNGVVCRQSGYPSMVYQLPEDQAELLAWFNSLE